MSLVAEMREAAKHLSAAANKAKDWRVIEGLKNAATHALCAAHFQEKIDAGMPAELHRPAHRRE